MIRALVAEDSTVTRQFLVHLLDEDPLISVVGAASDGAEAVDLAAKLRPDVILMDVHMPRLDGYEASRRIMERIPTPIVMASATLSPAELSDGFEALDAGALILLHKPAGPNGNDDAAQDLVETIKLMSEIKVVRRWAARPQPAPVVEPPATRRRTLQAVAIGASTGGPPVVADILRALPATLGCAVLVVQHIAGDFSEPFVAWLATRTALRVKLAETGEPVLAGTVYVAGGGSHMGLTRDHRIALAAAGEGDVFCPSVTHLFRSVADAAGSEAVGVLLSGMGRDGAEGLRRLRDAGAVTIAQDAETSAVYGMPAEAVRLDAATLVLPPDRIVETITALASGAEPQ